MKKLLLSICALSLVGSAVAMEELNPRYKNFAVLGDAPEKTAQIDFLKDKSDNGGAANLKKLRSNIETLKKASLSSGNNWWVNPVQNTAKYPRLAYALNTTKNTELKGTEEQGRNFKKLLLYVIGTVVFGALTDADVKNPDKISTNKNLKKSILWGLVGTTGFFLFNSLQYLVSCTSVAIEDLLKSRDISNLENQATTLDQHIKHANQLS